MFGPEHAEEQYRALENHKACEAGTKNIKGSELNKIFSYINNEGIETATYTDNKSEGWIDPFMFHSALKSKAIELGAEFVKGEIKSLKEIKAKTIVSAAGCWTKELVKLKQILSCPPQDAGPKSCSMTFPLHHKNILCLELSALNIFQKCLYVGI
jgi:glycine/D-amino acid oxidase-like deaminating enzyme